MESGQAPPLLEKFPKVDERITPQSNSIIKKSIIGLDQNIYFPSFEMAQDTDL